MSRQDQRQREGQGEGEGEGTRHSSRKQEIARGGGGVGQVHRSHTIHVI